MRTDRAVPVLRVKRDVLYRALFAIVLVAAAVAFTSCYERERLDLGTAWLAGAS